MTHRGIADSAHQHAGQPNLHRQLGIGARLLPPPRRQQAALAADLTRVSQLVDEVQVTQLHGVVSGSRRRRRHQACGDTNTRVSQGAVTPRMREEGVSLLTRMFLNAGIVSV